MLDKKVAALELALVKFSESVEERGEDTEDKLEVRLGVSLGTMLGMEGMQHGEGSSQHTDYSRSGFGQGLGVEESGDRLVDDAGEVSSDLVARSDGGELSSQVPEGSQSGGALSNER